MMVKKQTKTERLKKQYKRVRRELQKTIREAEERGYAFPETSLPKEPKRITEASVRRIKKAKRELYTKGVYGGRLSYGEAIPAKEGRVLEIKSAKATPKPYKEPKPLIKKPKREPLPPEPPEQEPMSAIDMARTSINNFKSQILGFPKEISDKVISLINQLIQQQGEEAVAYSLNHLDKSLREFLQEAGYDSNSAISNLSSALIEGLPDASDQYKSDLMDAFEANELDTIIED